MAPEFLAGMHVGDVALDQPELSSLDGIVQCERGVGVSTWIEDSTDQVPGRLPASGLLDPVDEHALVVRLPAVGLELVLRGFGAAERLDVGERLNAVDAWFTGPEQVEVRSVQHENCLHDASP